MNSPSSAPMRRLVHEMRDDVQTEVMLITPKIAEDWLANHKNVRPIRNEWVAALARDMLADKWRVTHQGICFDENGNLIDGQHRLCAVIRAGLPVRMLVCRVRGLTGRDPIDNVRRRTLTVITGIRSKTLTALGVLRNFETGSFHHRPLTPSEATEIYEHHAGAIEALSIMPRLDKLVGGAFAAMIWAQPCAGEQVLKFATQVMLGEMIQRGDPAFAFRNWKEKTVSHDATEDAFATCNCLRAYLAGQPLAYVYTGQSGYRALTTLRRVHRQPYTPDADTVGTLALARTRGDE